MMEMVIGLSPEGTFKRKLTDKIHNGLKCYEIIGGEVTGMSFVPNPANGVKARVLSEEDHTLIALILQPNQMIYRINPISGEEFYIYFTKEIISLLMAKFRLKNWTPDELLMLADMFAEGKGVDEISVGLDRPQENVEEKISQLGDSLRDMVVCLMTMKNKSTEEILTKFGITQKDFFRIIEENGGQIVRKENL